MAQTTNCRKCGHLIEFIRMKNGKMMPVDPLLLTIITQRGKITKGYMPHWATCTDPNFFREKRDKNNSPRAGIARRDTINL